MRFKALAFHFLVLCAAVILQTTTFVRAESEPVLLVGLGDSLMAGYQLAPEEALPQQLQNALTNDGIYVEITNAGVSGDTSAGGLARVDWSVPEGTDGVILELGANDALRGIAPEETAQNLEAIIERLRGRGVEIMLVGMLSPPNMGDDYRRRFDAIYPKLAEKYGLVYYPFVLDGVVTRSELQLSDGMHPNREGVAVMAERMKPAAKELIDRILRKEK